MWMGCPGHIAYLHVVEGQQIALNWVVLEAFFLRTRVNGQGIHLVYSGQDSEWFWACTVSIKLPDCMLVATVAPPRTIIPPNPPFTLPRGEASVVVTSHSLWYFWFSYVGTTVWSGAGDAARAWMGVSKTGQGYIYNPVRFSPQSHPESQAA